MNGDRIRAQAGTMMSSLSMAAADCDLGGLTFASGIPGTIGGGVYMNAGAYGGEMSQVVTLVEGYNMAGEPFRYSRPDLHFGYRFSRLIRTSPSSCRRASAKTCSRKWWISTAAAPKSSR